MGCAQAKPSMHSPPRGLEKLKLESGYVARDDQHVRPRRSTGQRPHEQREKNNARRLSHDHAYRDIIHERNLATSEGKKQINESSHDVARKSRKTTIDEEELIDGWPKWLVDNIPREALAGLVPKSADSYDKIDKLLAGLQHCHERGILHRDIKGSNLLIDKNGMLKIADFGLANYFNPEEKRSLTSRVVTLWYRAPELLLGATDYGIGIDLWSAGCLMAEMFAGRHILPGRTEVEQLHKIFKLCGTPTEDYWRKTKLSTTFRPPYTYRSNKKEAFRHFPVSSWMLLNVLLALDPANRGSASSALQDEFFHTSPLACELSELPVVYKEDPETVLKLERRRHKTQQRSQSQKEHKKKIIEADETKPDSAGSYKEPTKSRVSTVFTLVEPGSNTTTTRTSTSSSTSKPTEKEVKSPLSSPRSTESDPNAIRNINNRPPLPNPRRSRANNSKKDAMNRLSRVQRSQSTKDFRDLDHKKFHKLRNVVE